MKKRLTIEEDRREAHEVHKDMWEHWGGGGGGGEFVKKKKKKKRKKRRAGKKIM